MDGISRYIEDLQESLAHMPLDDIREVIAVLHYARLDGRQVFIMGNGGSAATASHFANDLGYEHVFAKQLSNLIISCTREMWLSASVAAAYHPMCSGPWRWLAPCRPLPSVSQASTAAN